MLILVCVKQVNGELNPFDASALECALSVPDADVTIISMGRPSVEGMLSGLTRIGVSRAILLTDKAFAGSDTLATSYVLSLAVKKIQPDLIICGRQSVDGGTAQVGPSLAATLGWPVITNVMTLSQVSDKVECVTRFGNESASLPALITVERGYTLRFPRLRSKMGEVEVWNAEDIGADTSRCGLGGSPTRVLRTYESTIGRRKCQFITPGQLSSTIDQALTKTHYAFTPSESKVKLPEVWAIGEEPVAMAGTIAETVRVIERLQPEEIAALAAREKPQVILWGRWSLGAQKCSASSGHVADGTVC